MPIAKGCLPCRVARRKCDGERPICQRCAAKGVVCLGYPSKKCLQFRNQNDVAKINSERARAASKSPKAKVFGVLGTGDDRVFAARAVPWMRDVSNPKLLSSIMRTVEDRATEIMFDEYIVYPGSASDGPGYLHLLPVEYEVANPNRALRCAAQALAYANLKDLQLSSGDFKSMALQKYNEALVALRDDVAKAQHHVSGATIMAVMVIDTFEILYLGREEPLGPHHHLILYQMQQASADQLTSRRAFHIFRIAHHRLQDRQLTKRSSPLVQQKEIMKQIDLTDPSLRIAADNLRVGELCQSANLMLEGFRDERNLTDQLNSMYAHLRDIHDWIGRLPGAWQPFTVELPIAQAKQPNIRGLPRIRVFQDAWVAYQRAFHIFGRIVLRSKIMQILESLHQRTSNPIWLQQLEDAQCELDQEGDLVVQSIPAMLGWVDDHTKRFISERSTYRFKKISQLFGLAACWEVRRNEHFSDAQRAIVADALRDFRNLNSLVLSS